jgi:ubiquinol-cytochrome c reductase iron-sulfur subunit
VKRLLCPCHQSTFDVLDGARPVFGPATRSLPQLPLMVDDDGFLRSQRDYDEPIGPGFWDRDR